MADTQITHSSPCEYTKATRWYVFTVMAIIIILIFNGLAELRDIRSSSENLSRRQSVLEETVQIRLKNIEEMLAEIKTEMKGRSPWKN
jgi:hypothetical protein